MSARKPAVASFWDLGMADNNRRDTGRTRPSAAASRTADSGPLSLRRILKILQMLGTQPEGASLSQITGFLEAPRSSTFALLQPLVAGGFLVRADGRYKLGPGAFSLASDILSARHDGYVLDSVLNHLSEQTLFTIMHSEFLRERGATIHREVIQSRRTIRYVGTVGVERPLITTASGRAILAFAGAAWTKKYLDGVQGTPALRPGSATRRKFDRMLEQVRRDGFAASIGDFDVRIGAVAAPIMDAQGLAVGSVGVAGLASEIEAELASVVPLVRAAGSSLSTRTKSVTAPLQAKAGTAAIGKSKRRS